MHKEIMSLSKLTIKDKYVPEKIKTITKKKKEENVESEVNIKAHKFKQSEQYSLIISSKELIILLNQ